MTDSELDTLFCRYESPMGLMLLTSRGEAVTGAWFSGQKHFPAHPHGHEGYSEVLALCCGWLQKYFLGVPAEITFPLEPDGTAFQRQVWELLRQIPRGETVTYGALALRLEKCRGVRSSARAVGGAVGRNPISILIPCHRVVGADGSLTGYAGGLERKRALLALEQGSGSESFAGSRTN